MMLGSLFAPAFAAIPTDSRPLSPAERATFLGLVCRSHYTAQGVTHCVDRIGYPFTSRPNDDLSLIAILYGPLTRAGAREAYVTYLSDWEPHATNYGGGILFEAAAGGWKLVRWYPGGQMDSCLVLPRAGRERFLCWSEYGGMGVHFESVFLRHAPPSPADERIFGAADSRADSSNPLCAHDVPRSAGENVMSLSPLRRSSTGAFAEATATYATPDDLQAACVRNDLNHLRTQNRLVRFVISGAAVRAIE
jgi:hypothetical protein